MRSCKNNDDRFCYICGKVTLPDRKIKITSFVKECYHAYFGMKPGHQDKPFALHICCKACVKTCVDGVKEKLRTFHLVFQWYGEKEKTTLPTAIFA